MISSILLGLLYFFLNLILLPLRILPDVSLPSNFTTAISTAGGFYNSLNVILPIDAMLAILALSLVIEGYYLLYKTIMWVIEKIPFIN